MEFDDFSKFVQIYFVINKIILEKFRCRPKSCSERACCPDFVKRRVRYNQLAISYPLALSFDLYLSVFLLLYPSSSTPSA